MYGAGALALPAGQKLALLLHIDGVLAEEELRAHPWGERTMSTDAYYDLVLAATMSEEAARRRAKARRAAYLKAGVEME